MQNRKDSPANVASITAVVKLFPLPIDIPEHVTSLLKRFPGDNLRIVASAKYLCSPTGHRPPGDGKFELHKVEEPAEFRKKPSRGGVPTSVLGLLGAAGLSASLKDDDQAEAADSGEPFVKKKRGMTSMSQHSLK